MNCLQLSIAHPLHHKSSSHQLEAGEKGRTDDESGATARQCVIAIRAVFEEERLCRLDVGFRDGLRHAGLAHLSYLKVYEST